MAKKASKKWVFGPTKPAKQRVPDDLKTVVQTKATELVEQVLKPQHVKPPPDEPQFNYITDLWARWQQSYFYFGATYGCPGPDAISPTFESKFARLEYVGDNRFSLAYLRHDDKWFVIFPGLKLDQCLEAVRIGGAFTP
jgi:hypothetical protein